MVRIRSGAVPVTWDQTEYASPSSEFSATNAPYDADPVGMVVSMQLLLIQILFEVEKLSFKLSDTQMLLELLT